MISIIGETGTLRLIGKENIDEASDLQEAVFQYIAGGISKQTLEVKIEKNKSKTWFQ